MKGIKKDLILHKFVMIFFHTNPPFNPGGFRNNRSQNELSWIEKDFLLILLNPSNPVRFLTIRSRPKRPT
jgi:hypothetical protein